MKKITLILTLTAVAFYFTACNENSEKDTERLDEAPKSAIIHLQTSHPDAMDLKWNKINDKEYEAEYKINDDSYRSRYSGEGDWIETRKKTKWDNAPDEMKKSYSSTKYRDTEPTEYEEVENNKKEKYASITIPSNSGQTVEFDPSGSCLFYTSVPTKARNDFEDRYSGAEKVQWCMVDDNYHAYYNWNEEAYQAVYSPEGEWQNQGAKTTWEDVPQMVQNAHFKSDYHLWEVEDVYVIATPQDVPNLYNITYTTNGKVAYARYDSDGEMLWKTEHSFPTTKDEVGESGLGEEI